jgi:hypothetical protein
MMQAAAAGKKQNKVRTVNRGPQQGPLKCITNLLGKREYAPKTAAQIISAKKQRKINTDKHKMAKDELQKAIDAAKYADDVAEARSQPLRWKHPNSGNDKRSYLCQVNSEKPMSLSEIDRDRKRTKPKKHCMGQVPSRSTVGVENHRLAMGMVKKLQPVVDSVKFSTPVERVIEMLIDASVWKNWGVKKVDGKYDMRAAREIKLCMTSDGFSLMQNWQGGMLETLKPNGDEICQQLSSHGEYCIDCENQPVGVGQQSSLVGVLTGVLIGPDSKDYTFA